MKFPCRVIGLAIVVGLQFPTAVLAEDKSPPAVDPKLVLAEFDVPKDGDALILPLTIKGQKHLFALDTGAPTSVFDKSLRPLLGDPKGTAVLKMLDGTTTKMELFEPPDVSLGRLSVVRPLRWTSDLWFTGPRKETFPCLARDVLFPLTSKPSSSSNS